MLQIILLFSMLIAAQGDSMVDFSGIWVLNSSKSAGLPPNLNQTMKITQTGKNIDLEVKVTTPNGEQLIKDSYILDGNQHDFKPPFITAAKADDAENNSKGKRVAKWSTGKRTIEVEETAPVEGPNGPDELNITRKWQLSDDGKTLTIEMSVSGPDGTSKSKRIFEMK